MSPCPTMGKSTKKGLRTVQKVFVNKRLLESTTSKARSNGNRSRPHGLYRRHQDIYAIVSQQILLLMRTVFPTYTNIYPSTKSGWAYFHPPLCVQHHPNTSGLKTLERKRPVSHLRVRLCCAVQPRSYCMFCVLS